MRTRVSLLHGHNADFFGTAVASSDELDESDSYSDRERNEVIAQDIDWSKYNNGNVSEKGGQSDDGEEVEELESEC